jgi:hypothetical protein
MIPNGIRRLWGFARIERASGTKESNTSTGSGDGQAKPSRAVREKKSGRQGPYLRVKRRRVREGHWRNYLYCLFSDIVTHII